MRWYKGNFHCHSNRSDGQLSPQSVAEYYKSTDYDFIGISDHSQYTPVEDWEKNVDILGIPCCEYSGDRCCHAVAVGVEEAVEPADEDEIKKRAAESIFKTESCDEDFRMKVTILQDGIDRTVKAGGIPIIAHPFWHWTYDYKEVLELQNCTHFELCNASPDCNSIPMQGKSYPDEMWDNLLSRGCRIFGVAGDDAHTYHDNFTPRKPFGGLGWSVMRAPSLTRENIIAALKNGHFYASTGVVVDEYRVTQKGIKISVDLKNDERVTIDFFGKDGKILHSTHAPEAEYTFKGDELYVRCRISSSSGLYAWTQPVFTDELQKSVDWTTG